MSRLSRFVGDDHPDRIGPTEGTLFEGPALVRHGSPDTCHEAAEEIGHRVATLRARVVAAYRQAGDHGLTPDECAARLGESVLAIRPRCTELVSATFCWRRLNRPPLLVRTSERRTNASGCSAYVLRWRET